MSQQIQITGGAKVRDLQDVIIGTSGVLSSVAFNAANGVPKLDVNGKILVSQLPNSVMEYKGVWNAATNSPTLTNGGAFNQGDVYLCDTAGTVNFGSGSPISFIVGDQAIYSGSVWQKAGGATGTVTSVGLSTNGGAITIGSSPITTSGVISANFNGTNLQYVNGAGNLTTFPTLITSIGLSMPSAFSVSNSPLTANGTIAVTGAGTTAQYIRGDGSLATFPTIATEAQRLITEVYNETGATLTKGTVVYINGGHGNLPTITKAIATGDATSAQTYGIVQTDITDNNNGYVVVIGSLGDLDTQAYANGTQLYLSSTTAGAWTSTKQYAPAHLVYVGIVVRSHPTQGVVEVRIQNGFEMDELHNVSAQSPLNNQGLFYNTSTSLWENKSIATALGYTPANDALVVHNTGNETIGGTKTFSDATKNNGGIFLQNASSNSLAGYMNLGGLTNGVKFTSGGGVSNTFTLPSATGYTFTFPSSNGTLALTSDIPSITGLVPYTGATNNVGLGIYSITASTGSFTSYILNDGSILMKNVGKTSTSSGYNTFYSLASGFGFGFADFAGNDSIFTFSATGDYTYTFPAASGTIALVGGSGVGTVTSVSALTIGTSGTDLSSSVANSTTTPVITLNVPTASATNRGALSSADWTTFNNKQSTITLTTTGTSGAATFSANTLNIPNYGSALSGYLPLTGGTLTGALNGTSATFSTSLALTKNSNSGTAISITNTDAGSSAIAEYTLTTDSSGFAAFGKNSSTRDGAGIIDPSDTFIYSEKGNISIFNNFSSGAIRFAAGASSTAQFTIASTGAATFSSDLTTGGKILISDGGNTTIPCLKIGSATTGISQAVSEQMNFITNSSTKMVLSSGGDIGIGRTDFGGGRLGVRGSTSNGAANALYVDNSTSVELFSVRNDGVVYLKGNVTSAGSVTATGFFESSDSRLKTLIQDNYQTKGIASITPKLYTKNGKVELGYYAQDFVGILDSAVSKGSDDMLSLSYREVLVAKVYALEQEIKNLKAKMN